MRFGYRRLTAMLLREGMPANHKRVYRLYCEEGLAMRIRARRRIRCRGPVTHPAASRPNERWSIDFLSDCVSSGRVIRMLTIVDGCTRECPAIEVDTSLGGLRVRRVLDRVASERGLPEAIVLDNGPEFRRRALAAWSEERGVRLEFIQPGKPVQNAYAESFNGRLRDECLNANWFTSLSDARRKIESWRQDYNQQRPHSSLNYLPPAEFAKQLAEMRA
jgi:putative transposase